MPGLTITEKEHWKDRLAKRIERKLEVLKASDSGLFTRIAVAMKGQANVVYHEIPQGDQDAALWVDVVLEKLRIRKAKSSTPPAGD